MDNMSMVDEHSCANQDTLDWKEFFGSSVSLAPSLISIFDRQALAVTGDASEEAMAADCIDLTNVADCSPGAAAINLVIDPDTWKPENGDYRPNRLNEEYIKGGGEIIHGSSSLTKGHLSDVGFSSTADGKVRGIYLNTVELDAKKRPLSLRSTCSTTSSSSTMLLEHRHKKIAKDGRKAAVQNSDSTPLANVVGSGRSDPAERHCPSPPKHVDRRSIGSLTHSVSLPLTVRTASSGDVKLTNGECIKASPSWDNCGMSCLIEDDIAASVKFLQSGTSRIEKVVSEIVDSERRFVVDLCDIVQGYMEHIKGIPLFAFSIDVQLLFGNIQDIYSFNCNFLKQLEECSSDPLQVAGCFVLNITGFSVFSDYCTNYPRSLETLSRCMTNHDLSIVLKRQQSLLGHGLPLGSYLLKPVQRILKYHVLLQSMLNSYDPSVPGYDVIALALSSMMNVAMSINEVKREHERSVRAAEIHNLLCDMNGIDISSLGELVLEDKFQIHGARAFRHLLLFQRALIVGKRKEGCLEIKASIMGSNLMLMETIQKLPLSFHFIAYNTPALQFTVQARTQDQKRIWCQEIKKVILDNYAAVIPDKAKQLAMTCGQTYGNLDEDRYSENGKKPKNVSTFLEKTRSRQRSGKKKSNSMDSNASESMEDNDDAARHVTNASHHSSVHNGCHSLQNIYDVPTSPINGNTMTSFVSDHTSADCLSVCATNRELHKKCASSIKLGENDAHIANATKMAVSNTQAGFDVLALGSRNEKDGHGENKLSRLTSQDLKRRDNRSYNNDSLNNHVLRNTGGMDKLIDLRVLNNDDILKASERDIVYGVNEPRIVLSSPLEPCVKAGVHNFNVNISMRQPCRVVFMDRVAYLESRSPPSLQPIKELDQRIFRLCTPPRDSVDSPQAAYEIEESKERGRIVARHATPFRTTEYDDSAESSLDDLLTVRLRTDQTVEKEDLWMLNRFCNKNCNQTASDFHDLKLQQNGSNGDFSSSELLQASDCDLSLIQNSMKRSTSVKEQMINSVQTADNSLSAALLVCKAKRSGSFHGNLCHSTAMPQQGLDQRSPKSPVDSLKDTFRNWTGKLTGRRSRSSDVNRIQRDNSVGHSTKDVIKTDLKEASAKASSEHFLYNIARASYRRIRKMKKTPEDENKPNVPVMKVNQLSSNVSASSLKEYNVEKSMYRKRGETRRTEYLPSCRPVILSMYSLPHRIQQTPNVGNNLQTESQGVFKYSLVADCSSGDNVNANYTPSETELGDSCQASDNSSSPSFTVHGEVKGLERSVSEDDAQFHARLVNNIFSLANDSLSNSDTPVGSFHVKSDEVDLNPQNGTTLSSRLRCLVANGKSKSPANIRLEINEVNGGTTIATISLERYLVGQYVPYIDESESEET